MEIYTESGLGKLLSVKVRIPEGPCVCVCSSLVGFISVCLCPNLSEVHFVWFFCILCTLHVFNKLFLPF